MRLLHTLKSHVRPFHYVSLISVLIAALVVGLIAHPGVAATPTYKQSKALEIGSGSTANVAFTNANVAGDLVVVYVLWSNTGNVSVSDSKGNAYAAATTRTTWGSNWSAQTFYAKNIAAGTNTVTATFATPLSAWGIVQVHEYGGVDKISPLDGAASTTGSAATMNSGNVSTTAGTDLLFSGAGSAGSVGTLGTGWTQRLNTSGNKTMDKNAGAAGSYNATASQQGNAWVMQLVAFKADPGTDTTAPTAPSNFTATPTSSSQVNLSWTASTDNAAVTGYQIERCQGGGCTNFAALTTVTGTTYSNTGLAPSTLYRYQVRATDAAGNLSAYSAIAQATTQGVPDATPPSVPTGVTGNGTSISQTSISWTASTDNTAVTGYKIYRNGVQVGTSATTSFQDNGLTVNTAYTYTVSAYDAAGNNSAQSMGVSVSTLPDTAAPSVPGGLTASAVSSSQVNLSWTASTDNIGVNGYKIYRDGTFLKSVSTPSASDTGLTAGATYSYKVSATDVAGNESAQSIAANVTMPVPDTTPPAASMTAPTSGSTVSGTITVSANATDNVGVQSVEFLIDGVSINTDTTAPYAYSWDTTTTSNGLHSVSARAKDAAGNFGNTSGVVTVQVNNQAAQLPVDLVAGWPFTEFTGTTTADATVYHNDATFNSITGPVWASGKTGGGVKFSGGTSDFLTMSDSPTLNISGTALTMSMWVNPSGGTSGDQVVFGKFWGSGGPHYQYGLELDGGTRPHFWIGTTANTAVGGAMGSALPLGQWSHLAVVYDGSKVSFYVNGSLISSPSMSGSIASQLGSTIRIGNDVDGSQGFKGTLDDVRIYKRAQTQADVQADMNTPLVASGSGNGPSVAITSPAANAQVSNIVTIVAEANDALGVQFFVDGAAVGGEDTVAPYGANWDTRVFSAGAHTLTARARNDAGTTVSNPVVVNVQNNTDHLNDILVTGIHLPTAIKFLPDGRMLVSKLEGQILVVPAPYLAVNSTPFLTLTNIGTSPSSQEGIFDFALDPNFANNHYFYVCYTANDLRDRLSRFTADATLTGTVAGSERIFYRDPVDLQSDEHHGCAVTFDNSGMIMLSTGEHFQGAPAQDLTSPFGKILRINKDFDEANNRPFPLTDNPFYDGAGPNDDRVWALGLRNPYRIYFDSPSNRLYIGDVGGNGTDAYEEVNLGAPGANYGWPNCQFGNCGNPAYTPALYAYSHAAHVGGDASVTGGFVYHANGGQYSFPVGMEGSYFFGDYAQNWIKRLTVDTNGALSAVYNFEPSSGAPDSQQYGTGDTVYLTEGPDGALYYIDLGYSDTTATFGISSIHRIRYQSTDQSPSAVASSDVTTGPVGTTVNFSSAGSADPEGQPLTYSWDFGDGTALSTQANPAHTYTAAGNYSVRLTVSDGVNTTYSPPLTIVVGSAPTATILTPTDGATFRAGDVISYSGDATDPDDGALPTSAYSWTVDFLHDGHVHPGATVTGVKNGTFTVPTTGHDFSGNTRYRITLTVTDSNGLTNSKSVTVWPQKVNLTFDTLPSGQTLYLDTVAKATPFTYDTLVGFNHTIEARNATSGANTYTFASWSDGGAQTHTVVVPATNTSYTATYTVASSSTPPAAAWGFNETSGTSAADSSGNGNTATLLNGALFAAGKHGNGLSLDGTNDYFSAPNSPSLDIAGTAITLSAWVNPSTSSSGDQVLLGKHWNTTMTSPYYQYGIELQTNGTRPVFQIGTSSGVKEAAMTTTLTKGVWSYLAIVWNGSTAQFYVNGTLVQTTNLSATLTARGNPLRLGADASPSQYYKGLLDDVRIYNRAQTAAEVQSDMNIGI